MSKKVISKKKKATNNEQNVKSNEQQAKSLTSWGTFEEYYHVKQKFYEFSWCPFIKKMMIISKMIFKLNILIQRRKYRDYKCVSIYMTHFKVKPSIIVMKLCIFIAFSALVYHSVNEFYQLFLAYFSENDPFFYS